MPARRRPAPAPVAIKPVIAAVVRPVTTRLVEIERHLSALHCEQLEHLTKLRHEQDVQFKRIAMIQVQIDQLTELVKKKLG
jgi:hypothetical protein